MRFPQLSKYFPILAWGRFYTSQTLVNDGVAAIIVTIMLIPQSLAYAMLAGLPPQMGLYASILPLIAYAFFGTSRTLSVGPVAVISLMTAAAAGEIAAQNSADYIMIAGLLAFISGLMLLTLGLLRAGFIANFLSHPVIAGFVTASGILIAFSQLKHIFGVQASGHNLLEITTSLVKQTSNVNSITLFIGSASMLFLFWARTNAEPALRRLHFSKKSAKLLSRLGPVIVVIISIMGVAGFNLDEFGVKIVGDIPKGLPKLSIPSFDATIWTALLGSALIISIIGFVESVSVAQTLAAKRRQLIDPDQELLGLGASNIASSLSGGFPVTGGFSRSAVNFDAGAETPAAGAFTATGIAIATLFLTPYLFYLPLAVLAATIIVAVLSLIDIHAIQHAWKYAKSDCAAMLLTILLTLGVGVETGVIAGVLLSIALYLYRSSKPHFAIVGQLPDSESFRNIDRHNVLTHKNILSIRIDENLYFANTRYMRNVIYGLIVDKPDIEHVILMCPAVNNIDLSALETLEEINAHLGELDIKFHLSEVKGPVMDRLNRVDFVKQLSGEVFLTQFDAVQSLLNQKGGP